MATSLGHMHNMGWGLLLSILVFRHEECGIAIKLAAIWSIAPLESLAYGHHLEGVHLRPHLPCLLRLLRTAHPANPSLGEAAAA